MALKYTYTFEAIGTPWSIETDTPVPRYVRTDIVRCIEDFDRTYSRFREDSMVSKARKNAPGSFAFPQTIVPMYKTYEQLERVTKGAVNPLVGDALEHWGYDAQYSLRPHKTAMPATNPFTETLARTGATLHYVKPVLLDVGAIGKGLLVDLVAECLAQKYDRYVVEAGGDMRVATKAPYVIGLENPLNENEVIGTISLQDKSICASSPNRRAWGNGLHHIIDATTGTPAQSDIIATWAIADTTMLADALSTALFFASPALLQQEFGNFQYIIMKKDFQVMHNLTNS